jgi:Spy/CpxP family protein refolding chaperone
MRSLLSMSLAPLGAAALLLAQPGVAQTQGAPTDARKEHLKMCVNQLSVQVSQAPALQGVMKDESMDRRQKVQALRQILTPQQQEQLRTCLQQQRAM